MLYLVFEPEEPRNKAVTLAKNNFHQYCVMNCNWYNTFILADGKSFFLDLYVYLLRLS